MLFAALVEAFPEIDRELLSTTLHKTLPDKQPGKLKFYVTAGMYPDGALGEIFIRANRVGSFMSGALDMVAMVTSLALQHGVPLASITSKMRYSRFPPNGFTGDPEFPSCASPFDLLSAFLDRRFGAKPVEESATPPESPPRLETL